MTIFSKSFLIAGIFLLFNCLANAQGYSRQQIIDDLSYLKSRMELFHPKIHLYNPEFNTKAESVLREARDNMTRLEGFQLVSKLASLGNEGHYGLGEWHDSVHMGFLNNTYRYLPLGIYVLDGRIYVKSNVSNDTTMQKGAEIHSINGLPATAILDRLRACLPTDGEIPGSFYNRLTQGFSWLYYFYVEQPETFEIAYTPYRETTRRTITIDALTRRRQMENQSNEKQDETPGGQTIDDLYTFEIQDGTGWLNLKSFSWQLVEQFKVDAKKLYGGIFKELYEKSIQTLVIDLRDNYGGRNELAEDMLPFILKQNQKGIYRTSISWRGKKQELKLPKRHKQAFNGKIYVLVNAGTFSSAASLARYLREYTDAIIIGSEACSRFEGFVAGSKQAVNLPNLNIRVFIPRYLSLFPPSSKQQTSNRGLMPDHLISYSIDELLENVDKERAYVEDLLKQD